jgi:hypothetical protein
VRRSRLFLLEKAQQVFDLRPIPAAILIDLEGTLTGFDPLPSRLLTAVADFDRLAVAQGMDLQRLHYVTNARFAGLELTGNAMGERLHRQANKPFFEAPAQFRGLGRGAVVIGDQYLTDGLLAWRMGYSFALVRAADPGPRWPRVQRRLGQILSPLFFYEDRQRVSAASRRNCASYHSTACPI